MDDDSTTEADHPTPQQSWIWPRFTLTAKVLTVILFLLVMLVLVTPRLPIVLENVDEARL
jgi:hypothetical protein